MNEDISITKSHKKAKKRGRKKWLNKYLFFKVDPEKAKLFPKTKQSQLTPINKNRKKCKCQIVYCDRENGNGLLKASKVHFDKRVRA